MEGKGEPIAIIPPVNLITTEAGFGLIIIFLALHVYMPIWYVLTIEGASRSHWRWNAKLKLNTNQCASLPWTWSSFTKDMNVIMVTCPWPPSEPGASYHKVYRSPTKLTNKVG